MPEYSLSIRNCNEPSGRFVPKSFFYNYKYLYRKLQQNQSSSKSILKFVLVLIINDPTHPVLLQGLLDPLLFSLYNFNKVYKI